MKELVGLFIQIMEFLAIQCVVMPLFGAAVLQQALQKIDDTEVSYKRLAQIYFGACWCSYLLVVIANYLDSWYEATRWAVLIGAQLIYLPVMLHWATKTPVTRRVVLAIVVAVVLTNAIIFLLIVPAMKSGFAGRI